MGVPLERLSHRMIKQCSVYRSLHTIIILRNFLFCFPSSEGNALSDIFHSVYCSSGLVCIFMRVSLKLFARFVKINCSLFPRPVAE